MSKGRFFLAGMALITFVGGMTIRANGVDFFLRFCGPEGFFDIVAVAAVFLAMAIYTSQPEKVDMLLVIESYCGAGLVRSIVYFLIGNMNQWMRFAHNIGGVVIQVLERTAVYRVMANKTLRVMAPFAVTA